VSPNAPVRAPMFAPFRLRGMELRNRVVVSPMAQYKAEDGCPTDWHLVHLGERAKGGAGLVYTEMTCVSPEGRITPGCPGLYAPEHEAAWARVVGFIHRETEAKVCCQIGHAGRKASVQVPWEDDEMPLVTGGWETLGPSGVAWSKDHPAPREMTRADMERVTAEFVAATAMAARAGFDMVELHAAHGYLVSSFISPVSNRRTDDYGGSLENRMRWPLEVFAAMRAVAGGQADVGADFRERLGRRGWRDAGGGGGHREGVLGGRGGHHRRVGAGRPRPRRGRSTGACSRRRSRTASGTRPGSPRWRSATSSRRITSTRS
jgi:2,4-dienoyl-CoA reductase-like NADH-dependent reductase (Old Yellow Enzyme family)